MVRMMTDGIPGILTTGVLSGKLTKAVATTWMNVVLNVSLKLHGHQQKGSSTHYERNSLMLIVHGSMMNQA